MRREGFNAAMLEKQFCMKIDLISQPSSMAAMTSHENTLYSHWGRSGLFVRLATSLLSFLASERKGVRSIEPPTPPQRLTNTTHTHTHTYTRKHMHANTHINTTHTQHTKTQHKDTHNTHTTHKHTVNAHTMHTTHTTKTHTTHTQHTPGP